PTMEFTVLVMPSIRSIVGNFVAFHHVPSADFSDFIKSVRLAGNLHLAYVDSRDIEFFAPAMAGVRFTTDIIQASVTGTGEHLQARDVYLKIATQTSFRGNCRIEDSTRSNQTPYELCV